MLASIFSMLGGKIIDQFFGRALEAFKSYNDKKITEAELKEKLQQAMLESVKVVEVSQSETLAKTYASFMTAMTQSRLIQWCWGATVVTQLFVLLWHQFGIPFIVFMGWTTRYPSSGTTVEWAYLLLAACLGMAPVVLRSGPGTGNLVDRLKAAIGK